MSKRSEQRRSRRVRGLVQRSSNQVRPGGSNPPAPVPSAPEQSAFVPAAPATAAPTTAGLASAAPAHNEAEDAPAEALGRRPRRATDAPVDAPGTAVKADRSALTSSRDRAALRAYIELAGNPSAQSAVLPSRRALRLALLESESPSLTSVAQLVPPVTAASGGAPGALPEDSVLPEKSGLPEQSGSTETGLAPTLAAASESMSIEEALAARDALTQDAQRQLDDLPEAGTVDPLAVNPEFLVQQRAIAKRAEMLNHRAQAREQPEQENTERQPPVNDPTAAHNLAMVTPLEFVRVPGIDMPVMRPPTTSHIPIISPLARPKGNQGPSAAPGSTPLRSEAAPPPAPRDAAAARHPAGPEAAAPQNPAATRTAAPLEPAEMPPLPAGSAHGLEPLDAVTAGLGRLRRNRLMLWGAVAIGGVALIAGFTMIITGLAR
ncbi:hypothetical protein [Arthrobacter sp. H14-L1]|uniref:hypothetical protein n=1 Tax=Arthrobacter sp. H14-L1 TaxID=2996697 RepID=UPI002270D1A0|nr:hypothetical protein [Arthrobacter sp. H14-L1]MCY0903886.1 hypothetical protein [Arthrobacter sp. H14-L1]